MHVEIALKKPGFRAVFATEAGDPGVSRFLKGSDGTLSIVSLREIEDDLADPGGGHLQDLDSILKAFEEGASVHATINNIQFTSEKFILGTDAFGRDMLSRMILGARVSLTVGFIAVAISLLVGTFLGLFAGYYGGWIDRCVMWLINVMWSLPTLLFVIALTFALGKGFWQIFVAVGLTMWVDLARIVRGQVKGIRELEYVQAGRVLGFSGFRIMFRHILPNITGPIIVVAAANFASAILLEAGLSFLGLGVQPPAPSWGQMLKEHYAYIVFDLPYLALIPGLAIMFLVMSFNFLGNGLRDALDVKM